MSWRASYADIVFLLKQGEIGVLEDAAWAISVNGSACRDILYGESRLSSLLVTK